MKVKELQQLGDKELEQKFEETRKELMKLSSQIAAGTMPKSPGMVKKYKKIIAKINAIKLEKEKTKQNE